MPLIPATHKHVAASSRATVIASAVRAEDNGGCIGGTVAVGIASRRDVDSTQHASVDGPASWPPPRVRATLIDAPDILVQFSKSRYGMDVPVDMHVSLEALLEMGVATVGDCYAALCRNGGDLLRAFNELESQKPR